MALTQLGFGAAGLGELWGEIPDDQSRATIETAWDAGLRYFDTAPWYGRGLSERRTGDVLRHKAREQFVLSTKVGRLLSAPSDASTFDPSPWIGGLRFAHRHDYTYDGLMRSFEDSLQRLALTRIDLLLIHDLDHWHFTTDEAVAAMMRDLTSSGYLALEQLKANGQIGGIGAGINMARTMPQFLDALDLDFFLIALCYTLLDQSALVYMNQARTRGMGFVVGGVFNSGILATGAVAGAKYNYADAPLDIVERVHEIEKVCRAHDVPLAAAALQFPLLHEGVASVIPGALSPQQVQQNLATFQHPIPEPFWAALKTEGLLSDEAPTP